MRMRLIIAISALFILPSCTAVHYTVHCLAPMAANDFKPTANAECEKFGWEDPALNANQAENKEGDD